MVARRVHVQHRVGAALGPLFDHRPDVGVDLERQRRRVALLDAEVRVAEHAVHVFVAEQRPGPDRAQVHRVLLADDLVLGVGVVEEARLERIEHGREVAGVLGGTLAGGHASHRTPAARGGTT